MDSLNIKNLKRRKERENRENLKQGKQGTKKLKTKKYINILYEIRTIYIWNNRFFNI